MRILHLLHSRNFAGTEQMVLTLSRALADAQCEVFVAVKNGGVLAQKYRDCGLNVVPLPMNGFFARRRLAAWAKENKIDLIHSHLTGAARMGVAIHKKTGIPLVAHLHLLKKSSAYRKAAQAGLLVAISEHVSRFYSEQAGVAPERIRIVPNATLAFDNPFLAEPKEKLAAEIRREYNLPADARLLVFPGRVSAEKGHETLLRAMPAVLKKHPSAHILIVGNTAQKPRYVKKLQSLSAALNIGGNIHFTGFQADVLRFICAAEAQLVLSINEPFGLVIIEAMAAETPVIGADAGAIPDILENGKFGTLVPPGNAAALADILCNLLDAPATFLPLATAARVRARELYSPEILAQKTLCIYREALIVNKKS